MERKITVLPILGMIMAECAQAGRMIAGKEAMSDGMNSFVFVFYSNAIASLILLPSSLLFHRSSERPPLTLLIVSGFFLLGLFGCLGQSFGYAGINLSSPTLGTAMLNIVPGLTFILAVIFRMENFDWKSNSTIAKSMGTIISIGGAFIVTYYKGPLVLKARPSVSNSSDQVLSQQSNWVIGGLFLAIDCSMASSWLIVQGVLGHAFQVVVTTWCLQKTGPVFVAIFAPLGIVIAASASVILFGDALNLGIVIGAAIIALGFYAVIWGKAHEEIKKVEDEENSDSASSSQEVPFLQNKRENHS
ncbi:unnamed protein product [Dovyalis caffra]|uniref:WAT1-related protein n=1 Tax=Dovyalis caffra TaxID=77055 RepID=A0AAV1RL51_9ROSI|nr:unnamed protein product [Dovyalis caffra]